MERNSRVHLQLGDETKYAKKGEGTILFYIELGGSFDENILYIIGLKKKFLSVLAVEDWGFFITF
jgi:hypothetical protein